MRYYLNVCDGHALIEDPEGTDYRDDDDARDAVLQAARSLLAEGDAEGLCRRHWRFEVLGPHGTKLFQVPFSHALEPATLKLGSAHC